MTRRFAAVAPLLLSLLQAGPLAAAAAAQPMVARTPTFAELKAAAMREFFSTGNYDQGGVGEPEQFFQDTAFAGPCRSLAEMRLETARILDRGHFSDGGESARYPRHMYHAGRYLKADGSFGPGGGQALDAVTVLLEVSKGTGFSCRYRVGAFARRDVAGSAKPAALRSLPALRSVVADLFSRLSAKASARVAACAPGSSAVLAALLAGVRSRKSDDAIYAAAARQAATAISLGWEQVRACPLAVEIDIVEDLRGRRLGEAQVSTPTCRAVRTAPEAVAVLCDADFVRELEAAVRHFEVVEPDRFTDAAFMEFGDLTPALIREGNERLRRVAGADGQSAAHIGAHLAAALIQIGAHEIGHLVVGDVGEAVDAGPTLSERQRLVIGMCRQHDAFRRHGIRLDGFDEAAQPGGGIPGMAADLRRRYADTDAVTAGLFAEEEFADAFGVELALGRMFALARSVPAEFLAERHLAVETAFSVALFRWYRELAGFMDRRCGTRRTNLLGQCMMLVSSYDDLRDLFGGQHRAQLLRSEGYAGALMREASPYYDLPEGERTIWARLPDGADPQSPAVRAELDYAADLQRSFLLSRLLDAPVKMAMTTCMVNYLREANGRAPMFGQVYLPVEVEMRSLMEMN